MAGRGSQVLDECVDEDYEPTKEGTSFTISYNIHELYRRPLTHPEINEYAKFLGIDPIKELQFLWIAKEGLTAPLPPDWKAVYAKSR
jgi:hypothetical protein